jgi:acyl-CoA synthetase (NDP forming)
MATRHSTLRKLTHPRAIAVIGASATPGKVGYAVMSALKGASVPVIPVHPKNTEILGKRVVNAIGDLPPEVDLAVVATGADIAVDAAEQCAAAGIPFVVVLASGFSEIGGDGVTREARLARIAAQTGTRILGPNTVGFQMLERGVDTVFVDHASDSIAGGSLILISQSGSVAVEALLGAARYGFSIRGFFGLGNKADLAEVDFLTHFATDSETTCIAFYIEDLSAGREFLDLARSVVATKPILAIKAGRTESGALAASSHTGRLSGADRVIDGALSQYLIQRVTDDEELCDAAKALDLCPVPRGNRVAVLSPAGGYGVMLADAIETPSNRVELKMSRLSEQTGATLKDSLLGFASTRNPVDLTASVTDDTYPAALECVLADEDVDVVICVFFLAPPGVTPALAARLAAVIRASAKPVVVLAGDEDGTGSVLRAFYEGGVAAFPSLSRTMSAVRNLERRRQIVSLALLSDGAAEPETTPTPQMPAGPFHEKQVKDLLAGYGFRVPASILVPAGSTVAEASPHAPGFAGPYVVKVCSAGVQHKTEHGGVRLGVGANDLPDAVAAMQARFPGEAILVEEMIDHSGIEIIMGAFRDAELGPCVMIGAGGILAELQKDVVFRLLPCSRSDVVQMIDELIIAPVFSGYRGLGCDGEQVADAVIGIGNLVRDFGPRFSELDLNPMVWGRDGLIALDAALTVNS